MGLKVHSLARLPGDTDRDYFIYLLDYGWDEPLSRGLRNNFDKLADIASRNRAVVISGFNGEEFVNEVFSYHNINGQPGDQVLPAILVTTCHPHQFAEQNHFRRASSRHHGGLVGDRMVLIPLKSVCKTETDVTSVIERIIQEICEKRQLADFEVYQQLAAGDRGALVDALVLQPNVAGVGVDLKVIGKFLLSGLRKKRL